MSDDDPTPGQMGLFLLAFVGFCLLCAVVGKTFGLGGWGEEPPSGVDYPDTCYSRSGAYSC